MSPIEGLTNITRLPRLGKIRLGIKEPGRGGKRDYPRAVEYFVCPPEVAKVYGDKPTELEIMFPDDDPEVVAQQWLRCYSFTQGLVCIGDAVKSSRKVDTATGAMAGHDTRRWKKKDDLPCNPDECPQYRSKQCRRMMNLLFCLPDVPGLGVWQIDTSSRNSILNINNTIRIVHRMTRGRLAFIPFTLSRGPEQVTPPGEKVQTEYCLHLNTRVKLADVIKQAMLPPSRVVVPEVEAEEPPDDLFPQGVLEAVAPEAAEESGVVAGAQPTMDDLFPDKEPAQERRFILAARGQIERLGHLSAQVGYKNWDQFTKAMCKQYELPSFDKLTLDMAEHAIDRLQEALRGHRGGC